MTDDQRKERIGYLAGRIERASSISDGAGSVVLDSEDELIGALACGLVELADGCRDRIKRHTQRRDVWAATRDALKAERDGYLCDQLAADAKREPLPGREFLPTASAEPATTPRNRAGDGGWHNR